MLSDDVISRQHDTVSVCLSVCGDGCGCRRTLADGRLIDQTINCYSVFG